MLNHQLGHDRGHESSNSRGYNTQYGTGNQNQGVFPVGGNLSSLHNMSGSYGLTNNLPQNRGLGNLSNNPAQGQQLRYGGQNLQGNLQQQYSQAANRGGLPLANGLTNQGINRGNPGNSGKQGQRLQSSVMSGLGNLNQNMQRSNTQGLGSINNLGQRNLQSMGLGGQYGMHHLGSPARSGGLGLNSYGNPNGPASHTSTSQAPSELLSIIGKGNNQGGLGNLGNLGQAYNRAQHQPQSGSAQSNAGGSQASTQEKDQQGLSFDASDFPALGGGARSNLKLANGDRPSSLDGGNHQLYSNLNLHKGMLPSEFNIQQEEFPALPGSSTRVQTDDRHASEQSAQLAGLRPEQSGRQDWSRGESSSASPFSQNPQGQSRFAQSNGFNAGQSSPGPSQPSGRAVGSIRRPLGPSRQEPEQEDGSYALKGLLGVMNMKDHDLTMIALGLDLTALGLPLNSLDLVYKTFDHPLADKPLNAGPQFQVPECYKKTAPKLKAGYFTKFQLETLYYIFYSMPGNEAQVFAADELSVRGWLYHKELEAWLRKDPSTESSLKTAQNEIGRFQVWDPKAWKMVTKEMNMSYAQIERAPSLKR